MRQEIQIPSNNGDFGCKVLLTGEYLVIDGAPSLAVPSGVFSGGWIFETSEGGEEKWRNFAAHLQSLPFIDVELFYEDLKDGLDYQSNIPIGYGLGSSGALVAGIYRRYARHLQHDLKLLKQELAQIESFFHGSSSGIDPLVIYLNEPVLTGVERVETVKVSSRSTENWLLFDSGISRSTSPLVAYFKKQIKPHNTKSLEQLKDLNQELIHGFMTNQTSDFDTVLIKKLSQLQLDVFDDIIDEKTKFWWKNGLKTDDYYFKLCGAGCGGMYLVYQNVKVLPFPSLRF